MLGSLMVQETVNRDKYIMSHPSHTGLFSSQSKLPCYVMFRYSHNIIFFIAENVIKPQKVVELESNIAKETVSNPHYQNITHLYTDNDLKSESEKSKQISTAYPNSHSELYEDEQGYAIPSIHTIPIETKDNILMNKILLGSGIYEGCIQLNQNVAYSPSRIWSQKPDCLVADQETNPLFQWNQKKVGNPSPEYAEIVSNERYQGIGMQEQHNYHI